MCHVNGITIAVYMAHSLNDNHSYELNTWKKYNKFMYTSNKGSIESTQ